MNNIRSKVAVYSAVFVAALLTGCAAPVYTTDDGSQVDEKLLSSIRTYGKAEQLIRTSVIKTRQLNDAGCTPQWELPFTVATSEDLPKEDKVAWVRGLNVDERLTVVSAADYTGLKPGDKIIDINGEDDDNEDMLEELEDMRYFGQKFKVKLSDGRKVTVEPFEICRGLVKIANPAKPDEQDFHWEKTTHPLNLFSYDLTPDEAMWVTLWTQGLSEEAGGRMMTLHYGVKLVKTAVTVGSLASGVGAAAAAAQNAAAQVAASEAGKMAAQAAGKEVARYAAEQAANELRKAIVETALKEAAKAAASEMATIAIVNAGLFKEQLRGVSWIAGTGFWKADKWALDRMEKMGADPIAPYALHYKLASNGFAATAFVFDQERLDNMIKYAEEMGFGRKAQLALNGGSLDRQMKESQMAENTPKPEIVESAAFIPIIEIEMRPVSLQADELPIIPEPANAPVQALEVENVKPTEAMAAQ